MENSKKYVSEWPHKFRVFLDGRDVTPMPLVFETSEDYVSPEASEHIVEEEKKITSPSESSSSGTSTSSKFRYSLSSPIDLGHMERPYDDSVIERFLEKFRTPTPEEEEVIPAKISQARLLELMEAKLTQPVQISLSLKETPTFYLLERPSLTAVLGTEEAEFIAKDNAHYEYLTTGEGRRRHTKNAETQTKWTVWKSKDVWAPAAETKENSVEASTYDLYQSFKDSFPE